MSNFIFTPEWAEQSAVMIAWPQQDGDFSSWIDAVEHTYTCIADAITSQQDLLIICQSSDHELHIRQCLDSLGNRIQNIRFLHLPYDDIWVRDTAPLALMDGQVLRLLNFSFNAWGGKYDCTDDAALAERVHASGYFGNTELINIDFVLEGGSVETDGAGTVLTTSHCLLNPNRNPAFTKSEIESRLLQHLGCKRMLWVDHGKADGDDTDAHIDTLARFCNETTIAYTTCDDNSDSQYAALKSMEQQLGQFRTIHDQPYTLVPLPIPKPIYEVDGSRLPATYANFLIINKAVLVPVYNDPDSDSLALERLAKCFPQHTLVAIPCTSLIHQYGSLHCMTMQLPKAASIPESPV